MWFRRLLKRFLIWRMRHISHQNFVLILSVIVGITSGIGAAIIKNSAHIIQTLLTSGFARNYHNYLYFAYPLIGLLITVTLIRYLIRRNVEHGIPATLYAISKQNSIIDRHNTYSSILTSAVTVGFGGSVGLEGPTVATGGAMGSNLASLFRMDYKTRTLLVGCAAAGALSAIFKAPVAAIVFAIEVIMLDLTTASLIPLLLASVSAVITSYLFLGEGYLFHFTLRDEFLLQHIPFYIFLGIITGLISLYFHRVYFGIMHGFERVRNPYNRALIGGVVLGMLIFLFPPLYGEGYDIINSLIEGHYSDVLHESPFYQWNDNIYIILLFLLAIVLLKVVATAITFGSGGVGGIFAPTLFMGTTLGFMFAKVFSYFRIVSLSESNFALVGMAGLMAGVLHAPLTAIFLIAEITGGYELFIPLMIAAAISYSTVRVFRKHSVYTEQLAKRGELITHHKDKAVLSLMSLEKEIENDFRKVHPRDTLGDLVQEISKSKRNLFPVVDDEDRLLGVVLLNDVRNIMFDKDRYDEVSVHELMTVPPAFVDIEEDMSHVVEKFEKTEAWNLPVIQNGKYRGFVSKSKLFSAYRNLLVEFSEE